MSIKRIIFFLLVGLNFFNCQSSEFITADQAAIVFGDSSQKNNTIVQSLLNLVISAVGEKNVLKTAEYLLKLLRFEETYPLDAQRDGLKFCNQVFHILEGLVDGMTTGECPFKRDDAYNESVKKNQEFLRIEIQKWESKLNELRKVFDKIDNFLPADIEKAIITHPELVDLFIDVGFFVDPNIFIDDYTLFQFIAQNANFRLYEKSLDCGVDLNKLSKSGKSILQYAVSGSESDSRNRILESLLSMTNKVNHTDSRNLTALHYAASHGNLFAVKLLIENGAYSSAMDTNGNTALDFAKSFIMKSKNFLNHTKKLLNILRN